ncbi:MAG: 1-(5-phosphoribosyl)-5-[(5-phosphoribosylamino)methylideneamino]imidazole-4-carboxamide isomerase [Gemmatimonadales bacterium]
MEILPAIDIRNGRVVRLSQGDIGRETIYHDDPVAQAERLVWQGARWIHLVDLDRAFGDGDNSIVVERIIQRVGSYVQIQVGGGMRSLEAIRRVLEQEVTRVVLGTVAVTHPEILEQVIAEAGPLKLAVGLDARHGLVTFEGWQQSSTLKVADVARRVIRMGVRTIVYTDITRDGMLRGVDLDGSVALQRLGAGVIVSGGVGTLKDLEQLREAGLAGVVVGRALYEQRFTLQQALRVAWE